MKIYGKKNVTINYRWLNIQFNKIIYLIIELINT